jgi:hypothetical protein
VVVAVKSAGKRMKKYRNKLELPNPGQVYHTALKMLKCYEYVDYQVNPGCLNYLEYLTLNYALTHNLGVVVRGVLVRLVRHAFSDYLESKNVSNDTKKKCYRWLHWLSNYVDVCYNFWVMIETALPECSRIMCVPYDAVGVDSEVIEKALRLREDTVTEEVEIRAYS